jgi:ATP-dependent protease ClpP protease subunit
MMQSSITAKAFYAGDDVKPTKQAVRMAVDTKAPGQAPPDLPSLLLDGRICYIGMPLVPSVTELVISELLWLNYASPEKPIYVYINSTGVSELSVLQTVKEVIEQSSDSANCLLNIS